MIHWFCRYDLDGSGTLNSPEEVRMMTINLMFTMAHSEDSLSRAKEQRNQSTKTMKQELVEEKIIALLDNNPSGVCLELDEYKAWYLKSFALQE